MSILLDGTGGVTTPGVVNTAGETIATTLSVGGNGTFSGNGAQLIFSGTSASGITASVDDLKMTTTAPLTDIILDPVRNIRERISGSLVGLWSNTGLAVSGSISATGNLSFNSGYGSAATAYGCRAWVNFNGTGTVAIRASGNVSSITDNGTGDYTVNFTTAMVDVNYSSVATSGQSTTTNTVATTYPVGTTSVQIFVRNAFSNSAADLAYVNACITR